MLVAVSCLFVSASRAKDYDVVIYGGTPSGIIAGVVAAREGATVVVVEPTKWIGGVVTVNEKLAPPLDQHFVSLGVFRFVPISRRRSM